MLYHVSKKGNDHFEGTCERPFLTISKAAKVLQPGDTVIVHEGVYRELVSPARGGKSDHERITYKAAEGEKVVIKGSERIDFWKHVKGGVWCAEVKNTLFGSYNPFEVEVYGDWLEIPDDRRLHAGDVYLNGKSFYEAVTLDDVFDPKIREKGCVYGWMAYARPIPHPEDTVFQWFAEVNDDMTLIYANFGNADPNSELTEISVRKACFYPELTGMDYITVKGFEMCQAACTWAPPTADQPGLIGPHWAKGWIIEDNIIHDAKCSAVSLGKEISTGHNYCTYTKRKPGYQYQLESVFRAYEQGWSKEKIGSHIVRNNTIYDCGQNGVVGHLGCINSTVTGNHIYNIGVKREFFGWEIAGIKLHAALDCTISGNHIHDCVLGTWLDWQAQGVRVSGNLYYRNDRDLLVEVSHGPYVVDNNVFMSEHNIENFSQGGAYVHNLIRVYMFRQDVLNRSTPYHFPHSTRIAGYALIYGGDDRFMNNIFAGGYDGDLSYTNERYFKGTKDYDGYPGSLKEYIDRVKAQGTGDVEMFEKVRQPYYSGGNVFFKRAEATDTENDPVINDYDPELSLSEEEDGVYLNMTVRDLDDLKAENGHVITTADLPMPRIVEQAFEEPDGSPLVFGCDMNGIVRGTVPLAGPLEALKEGKNHIRLF